MDKSVIKDIHFNEHGRVDVDYYIALARRERSRVVAELLAKAGKKLKHLFSHERSAQLRTGCSH